ncbi:Hypothetical predicted protein [Cloeon dipterum]|uniref:Sushi domain-containing protein n=1 Tax=Cloeon dipterum TaxID=197152 RepID=A0A8S1DAC5_9INSE|nr:Hypothetical predicted protein [Cloeon dipterum]
MEAVVLLSCLLLLGSLSHANESDGVALSLFNAKRCPSGQIYIEKFRRCEEKFEEFEDRASSAVLNLGNAPDRKCSNGKTWDSRLKRCIATIK